MNLSSRLGLNNPGGIFMEYEMILTEEIEISVAQRMLVKVEHLLPKSCVRVECQCDECDKLFSNRWIK